MKNKFFLTFLLFFISCTQKNNQSEYHPFFTSQRPAANKQTEYVFGIHPLHNPQRMFEIFNPIMDILSREIPNSKFTLEASRDYTDFNHKLENRKFHFTLPNPYQTIKGIKHGYHVFAKMGDDDNFRGIVLVRKDSHIKSILDLKGKKVGFPAPTALAASMMPQLYMQLHGLNVKKDIEVVYVGSQESSILSVYNKDVAASATWPPPWKSLATERPELLKELTILFQTDKFINNSVMARNDIDDKIIQTVKKILLQLPETLEGQQILKKMELSKFETASDENYQQVEKFIKIFKSKIGEVE